jgi:serine/threonine protein kinase
MSTIAAGSQLRETYTVVRLLGEGAFSKVYLVRHRYLGLQALKVLRHAATPAGLDPFREAFILSRLEHPNVIRIFDANACPVGGEAAAYLTMEYLEGGTLASYLSAHAPLPLERAIELQTQICSGLALAHAQEPPIVHRDVKPQNILLGAGPGPVAKVADFGLARNIDPLLRMASAAGTVCYMPPEGFLSYATPAGDVYSAGLVFYEMLTGKFPYPALAAGGGQLARLELARSRAATPAPPSRHGPGIPQSFDEICMKALQPDANRRYPTAAEFLRALQAARGAPGVPGRPASAAPESDAAAMAHEALGLARQYARLPEAIERMEEAMAADQRLRQEYEPTLNRWKAGLVL